MILLDNIFEGVFVLVVFVLLRALFFLEIFSLLFVERPGFQADLIPEGGLFQLHVRGPCIIEPVLLVLQALLKSLVVHLVRVLDDFLGILF